MERPTKITVRPPDSRGLREVRIGSETVDSAWSLRELRGILRRHGYPKDLDLEDRRVVSWCGGGSDVWPDHTWRRRATIGFMAFGLVACAVLLIVIGFPDAFHAIRFAGRMTGWLFILGGVVEGAAAVATFDYWGKRSLTVSGALVLVGVLSALTVTTLLVVLWFQEREATWTTLAFFPHFFWSLWALWVVVRQKIWRGTPHPTKIATGVAITAVLAGMNFAYSSLYQPTAAPANLALHVQYGTPRMDLERPVIHLPVTLHLKNSGSVPLYVLADGWKVYGRTETYVEKSSELRDRRKTLEVGEDVARHLESIRRTILGTGPFTGPGNWFDPGEEYSEQKMVEVPATAKYDVVGADLDVMVMRKDRGTIDLDEFKVAQPSWDKKSRFYCPPEECWEHLAYHAEVGYSSNVTTVTRKPRYVTSWWILTPDEAVWDASISSYRGKGLIDDEETKREYRKYDLFTVEAHAAIPFADVVRPQVP
ncbi:DUF308 domain-containing protein [Streptomyces sp. NPDC051921]|uniref:DUF308 domain-containing protein n=1 Tax=Streptomyces sp. NPDC051921 TaxID=3155806 RepID=UPI0034245780